MIDLYQPPIKKSIFSTTVCQPLLNMILNHLLDNYIPGAAKNDENFLKNTISCYRISNLLPHLLPLLTILTFERHLDYFNTSEFLYQGPEMPALLWFKIFKIVFKIVKLDPILIFSGTYKSWKLKLASFTMSLLSVYLQVQSRIFKCK